MTPEQQVPRWIRDRSQPFLHEGELHLWKTTLDIPDIELTWMFSLLSQDECKRAARFYSNRDRNRFVAGRGILRNILGRYLGQAPEEIAFDYGLRDKPSLLDSPLQFNLAHSDSLAVIAVTCSRAVGIDVERVRDVPDWDDIVNTHFSAAERAAISALPTANQLMAFFTCWTRKEAYLKATGDGIATGLEHFDVTVVPGSYPRLLRIKGVPNEETRWCFHDLPLEEGYVGAVAVNGPIKAVKYVLWTGF